MKKKKISFITLFTLLYFLFFFHLLVKDISSFNDDQTKAEPDAEPDA